jgi:hypothetical protein
MSSKFSNKYPIPENFPQILHDFAKEVVRYQPKDIIDFSFQYFFNLENRITTSYSPLATQRNTTLNSEQNIIQIESMQKNTEQSDINVIKDNDISKDYEIIKNDNSKNISQNNDSHEEDENNSQNNQLKEPETVVPLSKDLEDLIKNEEKKEKSEEKTPSMYSGISGNDPEKQGVKDFVSDLFF